MSRKGSLRGPREWLERKIELPGVTNPITGGGDYTAMDIAESLDHFRSFDDHRAVMLGLTAMVDYYDLRPHLLAELITRTMKANDMTFFDLMRTDPSLSYLHGHAPLSDDPVI